MDMVGEKVPMAFFPRFSTFTSQTTFWTQPMDLIGFEQLSLTVYRSKITGGVTPTLAFKLQESADGIEWDELVADFDPANPGGGTANTEATEQKSALISRRFVRMGLSQGVSDTTVTVFAVGWAARTS
jgi:hypothetical protein